MYIKEILSRAIKCDVEGRVFEARHWYNEGIQALLVAVEKVNPDKKSAFNERIKDYINRAEIIKARIDKHALLGEVIETVPILEDATGHSYHSLFGKYLNAEVKEVFLDEPYLYEKYQFFNLIIFFELLVKNCPNLKYIHIVTKTNQSSAANQKAALSQMQESMKEHNVTVIFEMEETLHDRKIILSNGYVIKIGRGLNIFKATRSPYSLGISDYDFRKCKQTNMEVMRVPNC